MGKQEPSTRIGRYLQSHMDAQGFETDSDLARAVVASDPAKRPFNPSLLSKWKTGDATPHLESLKRVAPLLKVRLGDLLVEAELATPEELGMKGTALKAAPPPAALDGALKPHQQVLRDPRESDARKNQLRRILKEGFDYWQGLARVDLREPSADERAKGNPVTRN